MKKLIRSVKVLNKKLLLRSALFGVALLLFSQVVAEASLRVGTNLYQSGDYAGAEKLLTFSRLSLARSAEAYGLLGLAQKKIGQRSAAVENLRRALTLGSEKPEFYAELGVLNYESEDFAEAEKHFREAVTRQDNSWNNYWLAKALQRLERISEAITYGEKAVQLDPSSSVFLASLGLIHKDAQEYEKALAELNESIALDPKNCAPYNRKATVFSQLGRFEEAFSEIGRALELANSRTGASRDGCLALTYFTKGSIYEQARDFAKALVEYRRVGEIPAAGETEQGVSDLKRKAEERISELEGPTTQK